VDEKLTKAKADRDTGFVFDADNLTLGNYVDRWINDSVRDTVRQRMWERYEQIVKVHIKPALGRVKLKNITPTHARALYREKLDTGLATRTVNYIHTTLSKALACRWKVANRILRKESFRILLGYRSFLVVPV